MISAYRAEDREQYERALSKASEVARRLLSDQYAPLSERFGAIARWFTDADYRRLRALPYKQFLGSDYWDCVRKYRMHQAGFACELCSAKGQLNVHHKTYEHHGAEHQFLEDLTVLCRDCHAKFHDKVHA